MVFYLKFSIIIIILVLWIFRLFLKFKNKNLKTNSKIEEIFKFVFLIYLLNLSKYVIFPIFINCNSLMGNDFTLLENIKMNTNIIPFKNLDLKDFILNIIMTIPMGCILPCLRGNLNTKKIIYVGVITGIGIEAIQFLFIVIQGFTFRNININDSIANFIGVYIGYKIFVFIFKSFVNKFNEIKTKNPTSKIIIKLDLIFRYLIDLNKALFKVLD